MCPEWIQLSRLKDFMNLRRLRVEFCVPWDLEIFEVNNQYQQSLLDLAIGHDTHFYIDFYAYDARRSVMPAGAPALCWRSRSASQEDLGRNVTTAVTRIGITTVLPSWPVEKIPIHIKKSAQPAYLFALTVPLRTSEDRFRG